MSHKIFMSSTQQDLAKHRQAVADAVHNLGMVNLEVVESPNSTLPQIMDASRAALHQANIFIGIYASQYGTMLNREISIIEQLYNEAQEQGMVRFIYLVGAGEQWADDHLHTDYRGALMRMFLDRLRKENTNLRYFTSPTDLAEKVTFDLVRYKQKPQSDYKFNRRRFLIGWLLVYTVFVSLAIAFKSF